MRSHLDLFRARTPAIWAALLTTVVLASLSAAPMRADDTAAAGWAFSGGVFDTADTRLTEIGIEYRFRPFSLFGVAELKPMVGISGNEEGGAWLYAGLRYDWQVAERWYLTPSFAFTAYEQGDGIDLGQVLEFRSSLEVSYRLRGGSRIGAAFYHLSNASLSDVNPGANSFVLIWSLGR